jgi:cell wall-associated NlpC family hydrolase
MEHLLQYGKTFLGIPYRAWNPEQSCLGDHGPFWAFPGAVPHLQIVQKEQMNCAGFINLLCRKQGKPIPGVAEASYTAGGTGDWYLFLKEKLICYDPTVVYPAGTLLLRRYRNEEDQGHLAVSLGDGTVLHSWTTQGVAIDTTFPDYYEFSCRPEDWIL